MEFTSWWPKSKRKKTPFEKALPPIGSKLVKDYNGKIIEAVIVKNAKSVQGRVIKLKGKLYYSMSSAAVAIVGYQVNGWAFWKVIRSKIPKRIKYRQPIIGK